MEDELLPNMARSRFTSSRRKTLSLKNSFRRDNSYSQYFSFSFKMYLKLNWTCSNAKNQTASHSHFLIIQSRVDLNSISFWEVIVWSKNKLRHHAAEKNKQVKFKASFLWIIRQDDNFVLNIYQLVCMFAHKLVQ